MPILLEATALPPEDKLKTIFMSLARAKQAYANISGNVPAIKLLELSTSTVDLIAFLSKYGGDVDLITHANAKAASNSKYSSGYDVQVDFAALMVSLVAIKTAISIINFSGSVFINADGKHEWLSVDSSSLNAAIASFNAVVI